ncbi:MAG: chaperone modulator CbpM [Proteobacteria bacterium]|nr:chaperone modulator CbpM [Pseudomonadota bacterium]
MVNRELILYEQQSQRTLLDIYEIGRFVGLHPDMIYRYYILGLIDPRVEKPDLLFEDSVLVRISKIKRLKADLGVNLASCGLILDLLDRITGLEKKLFYYEMKRGR